MVPEVGRVEEAGPVVPADQVGAEAGDELPAEAVAPGGVVVDVVVDLHAQVGEIDQRHVVEPVDEDVLVHQRQAQHLQPGLARQRQPQVIPAQPGTPPGLP